MDDNDTEAWSIIAAMSASRHPGLRLQFGLTTSLALVAAAGIGCKSTGGDAAASTPSSQPVSQPASQATAPVVVHVPAGMAVATFAGGCFWCMEKPFDVVEGVVSTTSGYIGGHKDNPTYKEVSRGVTGHTEAVQIVFDPKKVGYDKLLQVFWHNIDPTVPNRQFCDSGTQYRSGVFFHDDVQKALALKSKADIEAGKTLKAPIVTEITSASTFYPAEDYHQDFYKKSPDHYTRYRKGCGRDRRLEELWGASAGH